MRLSICIPTYNRARFLPDLFESIRIQTGYDCDVEIVVSDNASTDNTPELIRHYQSTMPNLSYFRSDTNIGADRNFIKVIADATGDYCWLMGSDDKLEPGAIAKLCNTLREFPDITGVTVNRHAYKFDLATRIYETPVVSTSHQDNVVIRSPEDFFRTIGYYAGYISAQVVKKSIWDQVVTAHSLDEYYNGYVHIYILGRMLQIEPDWLYLARPCVGWRSANDSFLAKGGEFERMALDVMGYEKIARGLFGARHPVYREINNKVVSVLVCNAIRTAKLEGAGKGFHERSFRLLFRSYHRYPAFWLRAAPLLLTPSWAIKAVRRVYRATLKPARLQKITADS